MYTRKNICFQAKDGTSLQGWFYKPKGLNREAPCIIMTHGFSALKEHLLDPFASYFATHQKCVLLYDNRNFGESEGEPRHEVNTKAQIDDVKSAVTFAQSVPAVAADKIGLWGTSFSGGIHLSVAAQDKRVRCVVAQVPHVVGFHRQLEATALSKMKMRYEQEHLSQQQGNSPKMLTVVSTDPNSRAIMKGERANQLFTSVPTWQNQVTLSSLELTGDFSPVDEIDNIAPTALMLIVASSDNVNDTTLTLTAYEKAKAPKKLVIVDGDHFAPYYEAFQQCAEGANAWFDAWLV